MQNNRVISRTLTPLLATSRKSVLLLGPRQTGKSTLMAALAPDLSINLAHEARKALRKGESDLGSPEINLEEDPKGEL